MPTKSLSGKVTVGKISSAWGLRGHLRIFPLTDNPNRFSKDSRLEIDNLVVIVQSVQQSKKHLIIKFDCVNNRTEAEGLHGSLVTVSQEQIGPPPEGSYYHYQIVGMEVVTEDGTSLGQVTEILSTGSNDVYLVRDRERNETLVPALEDILIKIDVAQNRMVVQLPETI